MSSFLTPDAVRDLLLEDRLDPLRQGVADAHPAAVAETLEQLEAEEVWRVLSALPVEAAGAVFPHLPLEMQVEIAQAHPERPMAKLLETMAGDDRTDLMQELAVDAREKLFALMDDKAELETRRLADYPEDSVGSVMNTDFACIPADISAREAIDLIRLAASGQEDFFYVYVIDDDSRLVGVLSLRDLILARPGERIDRIMQTQVIRATVDEPRTEAADQVQAYDLVSLPVVDANDRLVGVVTVDDVLDVQEEEATTDFHMMGSVNRLETGFGEATPWTMYRARVPWLLGLVFVSVCSGAGLAYFEGTIDANVALVFFLPLLLGAGGNAGAQSSTLMVRAIAIGDITPGDYIRVIVKEIGVSLSLGLTMALGVSLIAGLRAPDVMVPVAMTMVATVMFGSLLGMSLPFILTRLKLDPATASAPLITSMADIAGVLIYFGIATWYFGL